MYSVVLLILLGLQLCYSYNFVADTTKKAVEEDPCTLPAVVGPCKARIPRFFYNKKTKQCEQFFYGGCQGNSNNFETLEACQQKCQKPVVQEDPCTLPVVVGPCKASIKRYFFSRETFKCEIFYYGGCQGNSNNFETLEDCRQRCNEGIIQEDLCTLPAEVGPCKGSFPRYFFNKDSQQCEKFFYGGCQGNLNNFETLEACQQRCIQIQDTCALPPDVGPCKAKKLRYFYNKKTKQCEEFFYGGCKGNANNFETLEVCKQKCAPSPAVDVCKLPSESGLCLAYFERYFYNSSTKKCEKFVYGGCGSNGNNFETEAACQEKCGQNGGVSAKFPEIIGKLFDPFGKKKSHPGY